MSDISLSKILSEVHNELKPPEKPFREIHPEKLQDAISTTEMYVHLLNKEIGTSSSGEALVRDLSIVLDTAKTYHKNLIAIKNICKGENNVLETTQETT